VAFPDGHVVLLVIVPVLSPTTNSKACFKPTLDQMLFLLTLIGTPSFAITFDGTMTLSSDWIKLYLGKKKGAHVLGCT
jgi:hypothetical protein